MSRIICGWFALAMMPISGFAQAASSSSDIESKVDAYVKPYVEIKSFSGAILVARGEKVLLSKGYGMANYELDAPNTPKTRFHIASVSKTFTSVWISAYAART